MATLNAGSLSLIFGVLFIATAIAGLVVFALAIRSKSIDPQKLDKLIEIWKWTLGSFVIGVSSAIVSDTFKQREQDKNEMTAFNQYITIVVDTGTVDKKWQLCEFFKAVSPEGNMRDAWIRYEQVLIDGKKQVADLNSQEKTLTRVIASQGGNATPTQINSLDQIQDKKQAILSELNATEKGGYLIIAGGDKNLDQAKFELQKARKINPNAVLYKKGNMYRTVFNGFRNRQDAQSLIGSVRASLNSGAYIVKQANWCPAYQTTPDCLVCNP